MQDLPVEVETEVGALIAQLQTAGWIVSAHHYDAKHFGDWYIDLYRAGHRIRLVKDRSQYIFDGPPVEEIKAAGLWKAFDDLHEFQQSVSKFATNLN
jgi:dipeptidase